MNTKTKGKLRLKKGIFMIRVGKFYDSHLATLGTSVQGKRSVKLHRKQLNGNFYSFTGHCKNQLILEKESIMYTQI
jgi:hypothetical protein